MKLKLLPRHTSNASVAGTSGGTWRLTIPGGRRGAYRLAQLDDYTALPRSGFRWDPPLTFSLRARVSAESIPGTWGFGLWNDPFSVSLGLAGTARRLPALPNAAWFFHASAENHLSFRDDQPASGFLAATFRSPRWPPLLLAPALPGLLLLAIRPAARFIRQILGQIVRQDARLLPLTVTDWHTYELSWLREEVRFAVDGELVHKTAASPLGPLGIVLWIDNQYAAFTPEGKVAFGALENPSPAWLELEEIMISP